MSIVFNLFCLYSGKNLFDLFSAEEIIRQFGAYAEQFVKFCYNKKCGKEKNGFEILWNQLEKEFILELKDIYKDGVIIIKN